MKLGARLSMLVFSALPIALATAGCASSCPAPEARTAAQAPVVSTTRLTAADLAETELAPLVGKPQHAMSAKDDDDVVLPKDGRRHEGGGFSGYK